MRKSDSQSANTPATSTLCQALFELWGHRTEQAACPGQGAGMAWGSGDSGSGSGGQSQLTRRQGNTFIVLGDGKRALNGSNTSGGVGGREPGCVARGQSESPSHLRPGSHVPRGGKALHQRSARARKAIGPSGPKGKALSAFVPCGPSTSDALFLRLYSVGTEWLSRAASWCSEALERVSSLPVAEHEA